MKAYTFICLIAIVALVECGHMFVGTNVQLPLVYHHKVQYNPRMLRRRIEDLYFMMPQVPTNAVRPIQGILAFDLTYSGASVNITQGGIGFNFVNLRIRSDRGVKMLYDVYIHA